MSETPAPHEPPHPGGREALVVGGVTLLAGLAVARVWTLPVVLGWVMADAGLVLNVSHWMQEGLVPWRDFAYWWGPLAPLLHLAAFDLFGVRESVVRGVAAVAIALTASGTHAFGRRVLGRWAAAAAAGLTWLMLLRPLNVQYANLYCVPLAVWGVQLAAGRVSPARSLAAGVLGGLALALKPNAGGAILATLWMVTFAPRPGRPLLARRRWWLEPFWLCGGAFLLAVVLITWGHDQLIPRVWFACAAAVAVLPLAVAAFRADPPSGEEGGLWRRWRPGAYLLAGMVLAQASWLPYYLPRLGGAALVQAVVVQPLEFGRGIRPSSLIMPNLPTVALFGTLAVLQLPFRRELPRSVAAGAVLAATVWYLHPLSVIAPGLPAIACIGALGLLLLVARGHVPPAMAAGAVVAAVVWYVSPLWLPASEVRARGWDMVFVIVPWFALAATVVLAWPRASAEPKARTWLSVVALALGWQIITAFPLSDVGHLLYVAPYSALGLLWLVTRGWQARVAAPRLPRWAVAAAAAVPLLMAIILVQMRSWRWIRASLTTGRWPEAVQLAPPRADVWMPRADAEPLQQVYAALRSHSAVRANQLLSFPSPYFYWLTNTTSPTFYPYHFPGVLSEGGDRAEAARLAEHPPRIIVWYDDPRGAVFRPAAMFATYPHVTRFIRSEYRIWRQYPPYVLLVPKLGGRADVPVGLGLQRTGTAPPAARRPRP